MGADWPERLANQTVGLVGVTGIEIVKSLRVGLLHTTLHFLLVPQWITTKGVPEKLKLIPTSIFHTHRYWCKWYALSPPKKLVACHIWKGIHRVCHTWKKVKWGGKFHIPVKGFQSLWSPVQAATCTVQNTSGCKHTEVKSAISPPSCQEERNNPWPMKR